MKTIEFRAWDINRKEMIMIDDLYFFEEEGIHEIVDGIAKGHHAEYKVMMHIGHKDKNGKKIFEGDIIKVNELTFESSATLPENLNVKLYGGMFQLYRGDENLMGLHLGYIEDGEVIGNIYENQNSTK